MKTTSFNDLLIEAEQIQGYLEITCSEQPEEILERLRTLSVYCARSGNMLAQAKKLLNEKMNRSIMNIIRKHAKDAFMSANRSTVHQIDVLRSMLSYEKEQMRNHLQ